MHSLAQPLFRPLFEPVVGGLVGRVGGATPTLDAQIIAMITGEGSYYRVSDLSTLFSDRGGAAATTPAAIDGQVQTIKDKGPRGRHLVSVIEGIGATLRFAGGVYYLETNGVDNRYTVSGVSSPLWAHYLAQAARRRSAVTFSFGRRATSTSYALLQSASSAVAAFSARNAGGLGSASSAASSWPLNTFITADGATIVGTCKAGVGGGAYATSAVAVTEATLGGNLQLFSNTSAAAEAVQADWCGGVYLNREPSVSERATINLTMTALYNDTVLTDLGLELE